jgi:uncharacterized membrane protein YphA (DoxX/SURF4 family)
MTQATQLWHSLFRIGVGAFWLYFASQKWQGIGWMQPMMEQAARSNPVPGLHELLTQVVAPHWAPFALAQSAGETAVGVLLVAGIATRPAACLGALLGLDLALTVAFLTPDPGLRWLYYLAVLASVEVAVNGSGWLALGRFARMPGWLRS